MSRYLIYAFGEIILVMIGILLALQVNNWNENRKDKITEKGLVLNILENIKTDSLSFVTYLSESKLVDSLHFQLYNIGVKGMHYAKLGNPSNIRRLPDLDPVTKKNDPFVADKIKNIVIRNEVVAYFSCLDKMEFSYRQLYNVIVNIREYLREEKAYDLAAAFQVKNLLDKNSEDFKLIKESDIIKLSKVPEFQQLLFESVLKLAEVEYYLDQANTQNEKLKGTILHELSTNY